MRRSSNASGATIEHAREAAIRGISVTVRREADPVEHIGGAFHEVIQDVFSDARHIIFGELVRHADQARDLLRRERGFRACLRAVGTDGGGFIHERHGGACGLDSHILRLGTDHADIQLAVRAIRQKQVVNLLINLGVCNMSAAGGVSAVQVFTGGSITNAFADEIQHAELFTQGTQEEFGAILITSEGAHRIITEGGAALVFEGGVHALHGAQGAFHVGAGILQDGEVFHGFPELFPKLLVIGEKLRVLFLNGTHFADDGFLKFFVVHSSEGGVSEGGFLVVLLMRRGHRAGRHPSH